MTHYSSNSMNGGITLTNVTMRLLIYPNNLNLVSMQKSGSRIMLVYLIVTLGGD